MHLIPRLHDRANIEQTSSKRPANVQQTSSWLVQLTYGQLLESASLIV